MENAHINPTAEMDNALSTPCPSEECDCDDCMNLDPTESPDYVTHEDRFDPIDLNEGFYSSRPWEPGPKPTEAE